MNSGYYLYLLLFCDGKMVVYMCTCTWRPVFFFFCSVVHILLLVHFPLLLMWLKMM